MPYKFVPDSFHTAVMAEALRAIIAIITADVKSYRPISNLPVLSKLLERLVARQLLEYLNRKKLLPHLQSAYRVREFKYGVIDDPLFTGHVTQQNFGPKNG